MTGSLDAPDIADFVRQLDLAMAPPDDAGRCRAVQRVLRTAVLEGQLRLDAAVLAPARDGYARRLLHRDPALRYTVLAMVWDRGQGTGLHDHAGTWCVECVYQGRVRVTSYSPRGGDPERDLVAFEPETVKTVGRGEAGALIPPFEYHRLEQVGDLPAVTVHVYGGELTHCHVFEPCDGGYRRTYRQLACTS